MSVSDFDELVEHPGAGRAFERAVVPGLGDAAPGGRVRLDALARWLQDVALADVVDARLSEAALWVVRRTRIAVRRFPRFGEDDARAVTWCSATGRAWAQRRTTIALGGEAAVEAVALWVHLDPESGRPTPFTDAELEVYGPSANGREVRARLRHDAPPQAPEAMRPWEFRTVELDVADHINNAAYWSPLEDELLRAGGEPEAIDVEVEHRTPAQPGPHTVLTDGLRRWITGPEGEVHASFLLAT
ncbi:acyl-ACP thioesterase domain-containing protein [Conexibacter woesei]|uniref:acyl-ACP thioesterase domain-containing protein n=1 Tax=Conexibacter woesei TaxID=191495 RepID=UPI000419DE5B|nr:acyl-ACP thioesterase domain-containing protein [Conexibacter woesei]